MSQKLSLKKKLIQLNSNFFKSDLKNLRAYAESSLVLFQSEVEKVEEHYFEAANGEYEDDYINEIVEFEKIRLNETFPKLLIESIFILGYSLFEAKLNSACDKWYVPFKTELSIEDFKGRGVIRALNFLTKVIGISYVNESDPAIKNIKLYGEIRNAIVHNQGKIKRENKNLVQFVNKQSSLHLSKSMKIIIKHEFLEQAFSDYEKVISRIYQQLSEQYKNIK